MPGKKLKYVGVVLAFIVPFVVMGFVRYYTEAGSKHNGFVRKFDISVERLFSKKVPSSQIRNIAGCSQRTIYLQTNDPHLLFTADLNLNFSERKLSLPMSKGLSGAFFAKVDSPHVSIFFVNPCAIVTARLDSPIAFRDNSVNPFSKAIPVSDKSFILRSYLDRMEDQHFIRYEQSKGVAAIENGISEKRGDGGISTDGILSYDESRNTVIYISFYSNRFFATDTNLNLKYVSHTIDTSLSTTANIKTVVSEQDVSNEGPSRIINRRACTYNGLLYIQSLLKADNEDSDSFSNGTSIDIYDIKNGVYAGSLVVMDIPGREVRDFKIANGRLIILHDGNLSLYDIKF